MKTDNSKPSLPHSKEDCALIPQHKRLAMGLPLVEIPAIKEKNTKEKK